jgi:hypothetical protein
LCNVINESQSDRTGSIHHRFDANSDGDGDRDKLRFQTVEASSEVDPSQPADSDFIKVSRAEYEKLHKEL